MAAVMVAIYRTLDFTGVVLDRWTENWNQANLAVQRAIQL
jgi:hypothetical protein